MKRSGKSNIEIDREALRLNIAKIQALAPTSKIVAVVKANGYGHGMLPVTHSIAPLVEMFAVSSVEEAQILRRAKISNRILIFHGFNSKRGLQAAAALHSDIVIHNKYQISLLQADPPKEDIRIWLKIDTGMHRLGFPYHEAEERYNDLMSLPKIKSPPIMMSHFGDSATNIDKTKKQIARFDKACSTLKSAQSLANSAAILKYPNTHRDYIRPGSLIYGFSPIPNHTSKDYNLIPVMTLTTKLIALKFCKKGSRVGYGFTWQCPDDMVIGIANIGYANGYPANRSGSIPVLVNDRICMVVGRVGMDMTAIDLRASPQAKIGDRVLLWGRDLLVEEVERYSQTYSYQLLCQAGKNLT